jgi:phenylalanyl-tRNA synthetase beta chain
MKVPISWLQEFIPVPTEGQAFTDFCDALTMAGLEVEEILDGPTLYTKVTPNRGDWASILGTAREAAAIDAGITVKSPVGTPLATGDGPVSVTITDADACPRYAATVIRGVTIGPAPDWMQERLTHALGDKYKPVNNIVDITNYVMLELGQPLHAFDLATIGGGKIVIRRAASDEKIKTLDGEERLLTAQPLCICDASRPVAIAGIMGGLETEITAGTTDILLESAHFEPITIRRGSKALGLASEASYRFERFVDPNLVMQATARAAALILEIAGGVIDGPTTDVIAKPHVPTRVLARMDRIRRLLGVDVDRDEAVAALKRLGIDAERSAGALDCLVPSFRPDIAIEEDIAEEVGRIALGYDKLPETVPPVTTGRGINAPGAEFAAKVRTILTGLGLQDIVGHSLTSPETAWTEAEQASMVAIRNPMAPQYSSLRTSLFATLLPTAARAVDSGIRDFGIFELGSVYCRTAAGAYTEPRRLSVVLAGTLTAGMWGVKPGTVPVDVYFAKGVVEHLLRGLGIGEMTVKPASHILGHPYRTAEVLASGKVIGYFGEIRSGLSLAARDSDTGQIYNTAENLPARSVFIDLCADALMDLQGTAGGAGGYTAISRFPAVTRDIAPVVPLTTAFAEIRDAIIAAGGAFLRSAELTDLYAGQGIPDGHHAPTVRIVFQAADRTLTSAEVDVAMSAIRSACEARGAQFR